MKIFIRFGVAALCAGLLILSACNKNNTITMVDPGDELTLIADQAVECLYIML